ncbi:prohead protease [Clostridium beijerinckii]|uniref:prohead protease n=1 Tax=Clostridium beijerinckii TaxID=1520 RepID=UPI00098C4B85|nr:prohead protease [Clostridium beijerinckii]MBA8935900.1 hypothetical protein [Clostridium beijerinckii]NRU35972.1 hypothetical protein [Clostridium beijerinckii]NSB00747.1 hypothetical protein [Clostridium beijerinckii]OOM63267.1 hypothetical protein CLOBI_20150 [Clostridium beijerinckii]OOM64238.1 hypothetical protein CLBEIC_55550 [Clostridium beijerinckii]
MVNIKKLVKDTLSDAEILNLTADKKVYFLHANNPTSPYIEYEFYDENGEEWAENKEIATNYYVQVDIFSKTDYTNLENKIKEKMTNAGFMRSTSADLYENDTQLFHKAMRFFITLNNN